MTTTSDSKSMAAWAATGGRVLLAAIFVASGLSKLGDPAGTAAYISSVGLPLPQLAAWGAIAVELLVGIALIIGFQTRVAALVLALFSVVTALLFHNDFADQMQMIMFMKNIAIAGGLLQVAAFGGGPISIDGRAR
jgi:putative oxidoreductase